MEEGADVPAETVADTETSNETAPVDETTVENEDQEDVLLLKLMY